MHTFLARRRAPVSSGIGAAVLAALALAACSSTAGGGSTGGTTTNDSICASDSRATPYAIGLSAKGINGKLTATFVDALPAPPAKGLNTWTVKLTDAMGSPVSGATITVKTLMPDHGHPSSITPQVKAMGDPGVYEVTLLDFFMAGIWQVTLEATPSSGPMDSIVFTFCVDG